MRYYYVDENNQTAGPVEEASFYEALRMHVLDPDTEVVAEGTEDWQTLAAVLSYYFTFGEGSAGPLPLAKLKHLAAASNEPLMVMEPGGSGWLPLEELLSPPAVPETPEPAPPAAPVFDPYAPPVAAVTPAAPRPDKRPPFPGSVRAAGIIWILYGALRLIVTFVAVAALTRVPGAGGFSLFSLIIPLLISLVFLSIGIQTCKGRVADVKGNGAGSIGIGIVLFIASAFILRATQEDTKGTLVVESCTNGALVVAGILALSGRAGFLAWKRWTAPPAPMVRYRR